PARADAATEIEVPLRMSTTVIRRLLWLALMVALPVPYWVFEPGRASTLWLAELTAYVLAMLLAEGGMVTRLVATLFTVQVLAFTGITYLIARSATRLLARVDSDPGRTVAALATVLLVLGTALLPVYRSPLVAGGAPVNLVGLFQ
ncbi:MAG: hypothetical protein AB1689_06795, partial [Thermodesulfobacteriota bacterium]